MVCGWREMNGIATHFADYPTACGLIGAPFTTSDVARVDCMRCRRTRRFAGAVLKRKIEASQKASGTGSTQSRRHPARAGNVMESAGQYKHNKHVAPTGESGRMGVPPAAPAAVGTHLSNAARSLQREQ